MAQHAAVMAASTAAGNIASQIAALGAFARLNNTGHAGSPAQFQPSRSGPAGSPTSRSPWAAGHRQAASTASRIDDIYNQTSNNWALFTHNIFDITDNLKLTVGARYTRERKTLDADADRQQ